MEGITGRFLSGTSSFFCNMYEKMEDDYVIYGEHDEEGRFGIRLFCVDTA